MNKSPGPPDKDRTRAYWKDRGPFWNANADRIADMADRLNQPFLEAVGLAEGQTVLDLASGAGEPALSISRCIGPVGRVTATDLVPEMLEGARRRADAANIGNIDFRAADMERLPFADKSFDRVTCRFGLMFASDPFAALAEILRVLRPGGRAAFLVWGPRDDSTQFRVFKAAGEKVFGPDADLDVETPFRFGAKDSLAAPMRQAGYVDAEEIELRFAPKVPAGVPFWTPQAAMTFGPLAAQATEAQRAALEDALADGFASCIEDGKYRLTLHARIGRGDAPAYAKERYE